MMSKYWVVLRSGAVGRIEGVGEAHPVDRVLLVAVDHLRRRDAENLVDRGHHVVDVGELRPRGLVRLDARGHETTIGVRVPPQSAAISLV
jgi:hypothetical protein